MTYADRESWAYDPCTETARLETPAQRAERHALNKPLVEAFNNMHKEPTVSITPGELRGRTQPTILLRMTSSVAAAPDDTGGVARQVFRKGLIVFAQYVGNGRLLLTPVDHGAGYTSQVVMASALNTTAEIITDNELADAFRRTSDMPAQTETLG